MLKCIKCDKEATYDSPELFCDEHWAEWWVSIVENPTERAECLKQVLEMQAKARRREQRGY